MRIINEEIVSHTIRKKFIIGLDNGEEITIYKWLYDDSSLAIPEYGWEVSEEYEETFNEFSQKKQDQLDDFIEDIKL